MRRRLRVRTPRTPVHQNLQQYSVGLSGVILHAKTAAVHNQLQPRQGGAEGHDSAGRLRRNLVQGGPNRAGAVRVQEVCVRTRKPDTLQKASRRSRQLLAQATRVAAEPKWDARKPGQAVRKAAAFCYPKGGNNTAVLD